MSLFRPERRSSTNPTGNLAELFARRAKPAGGVLVNRDTALTNSAVYDCVDLIADLVSGFPVHAFEGEGVAKQRVLPTPQVLTRPSTEDDALNWRRVVVVCWLLRGYAAGLVTSERDGYPTGIELIHPDRVSATRPRQDAPWMFLLDGQPVDKFPFGPLWLAPGKKLSPEDPFGRSVLEFAMVDAGIGLAARKFGADFFSSGGHPNALITTDKQVEPNLAQKVKDRFLDALGGGREPVVMGGGWKYERIQISPNESQFLETIKANRTIIASFFKVPPHLIGAPSGDGMTYKNVEHDGINLLRFCVGPWVNRMEITLSPMLPQPQYVKLNMDSLVRPDLGTRYRSHDIAIRAGFKSVNEVRALEDLPPIEDGDVYLWPPYRSQLSDPELQAGADLEDS